MIDVKTMDRPDQIQLLMELERALGWYPIVTLDIDDVRERFIDQGADVPSDVVLHQACDYVFRKNCEFSSHLIEWAQDVALEIMTKEQTA